MGNATLVDILEVVAADYFVLVKAIDLRRFAINVLLLWSIFDQQQSLQSAERIA